MCCFVFPEVTLNRVSCDSWEFEFDPRIVGAGLATHRKRELENPRMTGVSAKDIEEETLRWLKKRKVKSFLFCKKPSDDWYVTSA
jgi:hypothetical protein